MRNRSARIGAVVVAVAMAGMAPAAQAARQPDPAPKPKPVPANYAPPFGASSICGGAQDTNWDLKFLTIRQPGDLYRLRRIVIDNPCPGALPFGITGPEQPDVRLVVDDHAHLTLDEQTLDKMGWLNYLMQGYWTGGGHGEKIGDPNLDTHGARWRIHRNGKITRYRGR